MASRTPAHMDKIALAVVLLSSSVALAIGERVVLPSTPRPLRQQLSETLCRQMECTSANDPHDFAIEGELTVVRGEKAVRLTLRSAGGAVKGVFEVPSNDSGSAA